MTQATRPGAVVSARAGALMLADSGFNTPNTSDLQARRVRWIGRRAAVAGHHADTVAALFFGEVSP